ncbi:hypothetical protein [Actinocrispum wychmicini]|uniref:Uncharacterized protein n=1 Tax=Actinocrispum wychmicini TaxID=1213861 RepID=A0A4R2K0J6_9PSEU|nr:hypothetical protein [Actinocrispum wychmicini]TCO65804.1 hypothetical protein EV192_1011596 [Actinocrispum wychmicini]
MNDDDQTVAKALLERAVSTEPPLDMDPHALLRTARRRQSRRRTVISSGAILGVVAVAMGAVILTGNKKDSVPIGPSIRTDVSTTAPETSAADPAQRPGRPPVGQPPSTQRVIDDRGKRLTEMFANAHIVPPGMTVEPSADAPDEPFQFARENTDSYQAYAILRDSRGAGRVAVNVTRSRPLTDVLSCKAVQESIFCLEKRFPDGSKARVFDIHGPVTVPNSVLRRLTVIRPNGSFLEMYVENTTGLFATAATRDDPPLTADDLFKVAATPSFAY